MRKRQNFLGPEDPASIFLFSLCFQGLLYLVEVRRNEYDASIQPNHGLFGAAADWGSGYEKISAAIRLFLSSF